MNLDPLARDFAESILHKAVELAEERDHRLARMIIYELAERIG